MKSNEEMVFVSGWMLGAFVLAMVLFLGTQADAATIRINSFQDLMVQCNLWVHSYINYDTQVFDSLMIRDSEGIDSIVTGKWSMAFVKDGLLVGCANNPYYNVSGESGWMAGYYDSILGSGGRPDGIFLVFDSTGNGWDIVDQQIGSAQDLADGDMFFTEEDILFGPDGFRGALGIGLLPAYTIDVGILPHMIVVILPQHSTIEDLLILCNYWLEDCSALNNHCEGADNWNSDGKVNFLDFAELASRW